MIQDVKYYFFFYLNPSLISFTYYMSYFNTRSVHLHVWTVITRNRWYSILLFILLNYPLRKKFIYKDEYLIFE